ncbi:MAG: hypothetical protein GYB36_05410 [Alphaproteobacteria bacterium]|nr:hypothetical protein [Alphaproteobacteria bacterium]
MSEKLSKLLKRKKAMLGINADTKAALESVEPKLTVALPQITEDFYTHMQRFSEAERVFSRMPSLGPLKTRQMSHWQSLLSGDLDETYAARALAIGEAHFNRGVAPYLYIAGYNFFQCELISLVAASYSESDRISAALTAITRVVSLDVDLSISVYTRAAWRHKTDEVVQL